MRIRFRLFIGAAALLVAARPLPAQSTADQRYLTAANRIGDWLISLTSRRDTIWPEDARRDTTAASLADGVAGVTLFFTELFAATGNPKHAREVRRGADWLLASLPAEMSRSTIPQSTSLYYGVPGIGVVLQRAHQVTGDGRYLRGYARTVQWLHDRARAQRDSAWSPFNDILFGDAGTTLFLLDAADRLGDDASRTLAARVGRTLIGRGRPDNGGRNWELRAGSGSVLPNFSNGTAGIGFTLATLFERTGAPEFLSASREAGMYLASIAQLDSGGARIPYGFDRPEWTTRYDLGWAHGVTGTVRFFEKLGRLTNDTLWERFDGGADVEVRRTLGLDTPGADSTAIAAAEPDQRFGLAGVAEYYLTRHQRGGASRDLEAARVIVDHLLSRGTNEGAFLYWVRPRLDFMTAAGAPGALTGYFHGASGYGLLLLRLDATLRGRPWTLRLPDSP